MTHHQLVVQGPEPYVRGFLRGYCTGHPECEWPMFHKDVGIEHSSPLERLEQWVGLLHPLVWVAVREQDLPAIRAAIEDPRNVEVHVREIRPIVAATFPFTTAVFSKVEAERVHDAFERHVPEGVVVEGWDPQTRIDAAAKGPELYSVAHEFELRGSGTVHGDFAGVVCVHNRAAAIAQVAAGLIRLKLGEPLPS